MAAEYDVPPHEYTPLETLLLFHNLSTHGQHPSSFNLISNILLKNPLVCNDRTYDRGRLSADALREYAHRQLRDAHRQLKETGMDVAVGPVANGDGAHTGSPAIRRRSIKSPTASTTMLNGTESLSLIQTITTQLFESYKKSIITQIRKEEKRYLDAQRDIQEIKKGNWDDMLVKEEITRMKSVSESNSSRDNSIRSSPTPAGERRPSESEATPRAPTPNPPKQRSQPRALAPQPATPRTIVPQPTTPRTIVPQPTTPRAITAPLATHIATPVSATRASERPAFIAQHNPAVSMSTASAPQLLSAAISLPSPVPPRLHSFAFPAHQSPGSPLARTGSGPSRTPLPPPPQVVIPTLRATQVAASPAEQRQNNSNLSQAMVSQRLRDAVQVTREPTSASPVMSPPPLPQTPSSRPPLLLTQSPVRSSPVSRPDAVPQDQSPVRVSPVMSRPDIVPQANHVTNSVPLAAHLPPVKLDAPSPSPRTILPPLTPQNMTGPPRTASALPPIAPQPPHKPQVSQQVPQTVDPGINPLQQLADVANGRWEQMVHRSPVSSSPNAYAHRPYSQPSSLHSNTAGGNFSILYTTTPGAPLQHSAPNSNMRQLPLPQTNFPQPYATYHSPTQPLPLHSGKTFHSIPPQSAHRSPLVQPLQPMAPPAHIPTPPQQVSPRKSRPSSLTTTPKQPLPHTPVLAERRLGTPPRPGPEDISPISTPSPSPQPLPSPQPATATTDTEKDRGRKRGVDEMEPENTRSPPKPAEEGLPEDKHVEKRAKSVSDQEPEPSKPPPSERTRGRRRGRARGGWRGGLRKAAAPPAVDSPPPPEENLDDAAAALVPAPPTPPPAQESPITPPHPARVPIPSARPIISATSTPKYAVRESGAPVAAPSSTVEEEDSDVVMIEPPPPLRAKRERDTTATFHTTGPLPPPPPVKAPTTPQDRKRKRTASPEPMSEPEQESDYKPSVPITNNNPFQPPKMEHQSSSMTLNMASPALAPLVVPVGQQPVVVATKKFSTLVMPLLANIGGHRFANLFSAPVGEKNAPGYRNLVYRPQDLKNIKAAVRFGAASLLPPPRTPSNAATPTTDTPPATLPSAPSFPVAPATSTSLTIPATTFNTPPRGIVNSLQLEKELFRMFANAAMYNKSSTEVAKESAIMSREVESMVENFRTAEEAGTRKALFALSGRKYARDGSALDWWPGASGRGDGSERGDGSIRGDGSVRGDGGSVRAESEARREGSPARTETEAGDIDEADGEDGGGSNGGGSNRGSSTGGGGYSTITAERGKGKGRGRGRKKKLV